MTPPLAQRELGRTGLGVCTLGFGSAGIGNLYRVLPDEDAAQAVRESFAGGVRYFDTAPFYGFGLSELRLGAVLREAASLPVISTKVGRRLVPTGPQDQNTGRHGYFSPRPFAPVFDYGYDSVMRSHEQSLERLGVKRVDILLCHDIGRLTHGEQHGARVREFLEGGYRALRELRDSGQVRAIGLGVNESEVCVELLAHCELDCILLAGRYTLLEQPSLEELLPLCVRRGVSILCGGPFNSGILATGARPGATFFYVEAEAEVMARTRRIETVCARHRVAIAAAALQFPLAHPAVSSVVTGMCNPAEAQQNLAHLRAAIPADFWRELKTEGLIAEAAPVPAGL